ncbi:DUF2782 domain-containing protein [Rhodoferax sp. 4810]|uniref:DUF2782 domain-containing protein n=1 Tax=Thiospirillum jenense TaxID=1653858 RepID=A0A839HE42_9GAMM|nr:DUF2782 domain-containing protein [Thiospirillum jenense]MBB1075826.1 DUF2782 domain-containing protein [Rhodoferax jenense]MBB1126901.1 DUF2782 domain-containing protein [Thiospirillum jenense]
MKQRYLLHLSFALAMMCSITIAAPPASWDGNGVVQEELEPEVTITETPSETITSYRVKGQVYLVKIQPMAGAPYYLVDTNGDGVLDVQQAETSELAVPQWLLFKW